MDSGEITLGTTLARMDKWGKDDDLTVMFPTYYAGDLGDFPLCHLWVTKDKVVTNVEQLYCMMTYDWTLKVWGPRANEQKKAVGFFVSVTGVASPVKPAAV